jgi:single-strand DNA-binding protein
MASYNRVILMGNLTRDPELRYTASNTAIAKLGLAVNDRYKDKGSGEWVDRANFIDCTAFGRTAEVINQYFQKGRPIFIEGKLRYDQWEDKQSGAKRSKLEVIVDTFEFVGGRDGDNQGGSSGGGSGGGRSYDRGNSSSGGGGGGAPSSGGGSSGGGGSGGGTPHQAVDEDDIPF